MLNHIPQENVAVRPVLSLFSLLVTLLHSETVLVIVPMHWLTKSDVKSLIPSSSIAPLLKLDHFPNSVCCAWWKQSPLLALLCCHIHCGFREVWLKYLNCWLSMLNVQILALLLTVMSSPVEVVAQYDFSVADSYSSSRAWESEDKRKCQKVF